MVCYGKNFLSYIIGAGMALEILTVATTNTFNKRNSDDYRSL
jgi:hypothetical protein